jgi:ATP-dependent protease HslVU (ClpYQ) peptidase subunit
LLTRSFCSQGGSLRFDEKPELERLVDRLCKGIRAHEGRLARSSVDLAKDDRTAVSSLPDLHDAIRRKLVQG